MAITAQESKIKPLVQELKIKTIDKSMDDKDVNKKKQGFQSLYDIFSSKLLKNQLLDDKEINILLLGIEKCLKDADIDKEITDKFTKEIKKKLTSDHNRLDLLSKKHKSDVVKCEIIKCLQDMLSPKDEMGEPIIYVDDKIADRNNKGVSNRDRNNKDRNKVTPGDKNKINKQLKNSRDIKG